MHTARGFSVLYHVFARKQYAFSVLHYVISVALHYSVTSIRDFSAPGTIVPGSIRLPRGFSLAITIIIVIIIIIIIIIIISVLMSLFRKSFTP